MNIKAILIVMIGGGCGAVARYVVSVWAGERWGVAFPYGTLIVNLVGCFVISLFMVLAAERWVVSPYLKLLVTVGFLGGLTTFSSFSYETIQLMQANNFAGAFGNIALNAVGGILAAWLGLFLGRLL